MSRSSTTVLCVVVECQVYAACRERFQLFYEDGARRAQQQQRTARAREVCEQCPVQPYCAAYALRSREQYGIWGGLTEADRTRLALVGWEDLADAELETVDLPALRARLR